MSPTRPPALHDWSLNVGHFVSGGGYALEHQRGCWTLLVLCIPSPGRSIFNETLFFLHSFHPLAQVNHARWIQKHPTAHSVHGITLSLMALKMEWGHYKMWWRCVSWFSNIFTLTLFHLHFFWSTIHNGNQAWLKDQCCSAPLGSQRSLALTSGRWGAAQWFTAA